MNNLVKITQTDDGDVIPPSERKWCMLIDWAGGHCTLCTHEYFGFAEGDARAETKQVKRGGITCPDCLAIIREIKAVRL